MLHSCSTLVFKPLIPRRSTLYFLSLPPHHRPLVLAVLLRHLPSLPPDSLRVLRWNARDFRARSTALLHFLSFHLVDLICMQESNLNSSSGFLDIPLCVLIAPTPGLAFPLLMPRTLAAASSFSSGGAYPSVNFLLPFFLRLIPTLIM